VALLATQPSKQEQLQDQALQSYIRHWFCFEKPRGFLYRDEAHHSSSTDKKTGHCSSD